MKRKPKSPKKKSSRKSPPKKETKEKKVIENLIKVIEQNVSGKSYSPLREKELFLKLQLPEQHASTFKQAVHIGAKRGLFKKEGGRIKPTMVSGEVVTGVLRVHPRGFGFLQPDPSGALLEDVFVPKQLTMNAVDGDQVEVLVNPESFSDRGPEGRVLAILQRARRHLAGTVIGSQGKKAALVYAPLLGKGSKVVVELGSDEEVRIGDRIVLEVKEWGDKDSETTATLQHIIGHISDPSCDIAAAVEEFGLNDRFPFEVTKEASSFGDEVSQEDMKGREDLQKEVCFTIDPDTAKDFDDAVGLTKDKKGHYHLSVHIADVSHYVRPGSALEKEALKRANSVYFPGKVLPMLPEVLSNQLCSLRPRTPRLAVSVLMELDTEGKLVEYSICRSVIKSRIRMTYGDAKEILDGEKKSPYSKALWLMVELCEKLKKVRSGRGSIEFAMPELVIRVDEKGMPTGTEIVEYDITHQMIEEFMLKANEVVATHLDQEGKSLAYRIHDEPAEENIREFATLARTFGYPVADLPTIEDLQNLFDEAKNSPHGQYLSQSFIRRLKMANYSPHNIGHYGLALTHYCHFTSPIRRYADLLVHRVLFGDEAELDEVERISLHCSDQERIAAKAESSVVYLKKLRLVKDQSERKEKRDFEAVVTKMKPFGFYFEVIDFDIEGFFHVSDLAEDFYTYDEAKMQLVGKRSKKRYQPGTPITLYLVDVDLALQEIQWDLIEEGTGEVSRSPKKPKRRKVKRKR